MAAQTWQSLRVTFLAATVKAQSPYNAVVPDFDALFPQATSYAEGRIYRDLVLLATRKQDTSLTTITGNRSVAIGPTGIIVPEGFALLAPAGTRVPFDAASLDMIDQIWPVEAATVAPSISAWTPNLWALLDDHTIVYAPTADNSYTIELTGLFQPAPITQANPQTYLSTVYPELLEAACMVFLTGWLLHNYGSQSDNPQQAISYEGQYMTLMASAKAEEMRRRGLFPDRAAGGAK